MKFSICTEMIFNNLDFNKKIQQISDEGFEYCEFWTWKDKNWKTLKKTVKDKGIRISAFSGDDKYSLSDPEDSRLYIDFISQSIKKAVDSGCPFLVIHSEALMPDGRAKKSSQALSDDEKLMTVYSMLKQIAPLAEKNNITLVIEPLNTIRDHKGYYLSSCDKAFEITRKVSSPFIKVLFDIYHMQIMSGNIIDAITRNIDQIGYIHAADVPGRNEPGTGELNYSSILKALKDAGYSSFVGFEYMPASGDAESLKAVKKTIKPFL